jgi:hypothetical protein
VAAARTRTWCARPHGCRDGARGHWEAGGVRVRLDTRHVPDGRAAGGPPTGQLQGDHDITGVRAQPVRYRRGPRRRAWPSAAVPLHDGGHDEGQRGGPRARTRGGGCTWTQPMLAVRPSAPSSGDTSTARSWQTW